MKWVPDGVELGLGVLCHVRTNTLIIIVAGRYNLNTGSKAEHQSCSSTRLFKNNDGIQDRSLVLYVIYSAVKLMIIH